MFCKHLDDSYFVTAFYTTRRVDFHKFFVPFGYKVSQICPITNGVTILIDKSNDLIQDVIPAIHEHYKSQPSVTI